MLEVDISGKFDRVVKSIESGDIGILNGNSSSRLEDTADAAALFDGGTGDFCSVCDGDFTCELFDVEIFDRAPGVDRAFVDEFAVKGVAVAEVDDSGVLYDDIETILNGGESHGVTGEVTVFADIHGDRITVAAGAVNIDTGVVEFERTLGTVVTDQAPGVCGAAEQNIGIGELKCAALICLEHASLDLSVGCGQNGSSETADHSAVGIGDQLIFGVASSVDVGTGDRDAAAVGAELFKTEFSGGGNGHVVVVDDDHAAAECAVDIKCVSACIGFDIEVCLAVTDGHKDVLAEVGN